MKKRKERKKIMKKKGERENRKRNVRKTVKEKRVNGGESWKRIKERKRKEKEEKK